MRKRLLIIVGGLVALGFIGMVALPFLVDVNQYRGLIQSQLEDKLKRKVTLGEISLHRFPISLEVQDVSIGEDPAVSSSAPFAAAKTIMVKPGLMALLRKRVEVTSLVLDRPTIEVIRKADDTWNFATLGAKDASSSNASLTIDDLDIRNGVVAFTDLKAKQARTVYDDIDIHLQNYAPGKDYKLYAAAHLPPGKFDFQGTGRDSDVLIGKVTLKDVQILSLVKFLNTPGIEGSEGILNGSADIDYTKDKAGAKGDLSIANAKVGKHVIDFPVSMAFDLAEDRATKLLKIASLQAKLGGNSFGIAGEADLKSSPAVVHLKARQLKGSLTELAHVAALLGVASTPGLVMKGNLDGDVSIDGPTNHPALNGHLEIAGFEASSKEWKQPVKAPAVRLDFDPTTVRAAPMALSSGGTQLTARATVTDYTTEGPKIDADVKTNGATVEELLNIAAAFGLSATAGVTGHGGAAVDIHASGSAKNPNIAGLMSLDNATLTMPSLAKPLSVAHLNLKFAENSASIDNLAVNLGGANITGNLTMKNFAAPQVTFAINADKLDVAQLQAAEANAPASGGSTTKGPSALEKLTAKGTLSAGELISNGLILTQLKASLNMDHGVATLAPLTAGLFGGTVNGTIVADLRPATPTYRTTLKMAQVDANGLLSAVTPVKQTVFGKLVSDGTLSFSGTTEATLTRSLNGTLNLRLAEGRLMGVNLMNEVSKVGKFLGMAGDTSNFTKITLLSAALAIQNGMANATDMKLETDGATIVGAGTINLVDQTVDLHMTAGLSKDLSDKAGGNGIGGMMVTALSGASGALVVPVHVTGPLGSPRVTPDAEAFARMKLQSFKNPAEIGNTVLGIFDRLTKKKDDKK